MRLQKSAQVVLEKASKTFISEERGAVETLQELSLSAKPGEFLVIVGPSGCGKSTVLNLIAGFDQPSAGTVLVDDKRVEKPGGKTVMLFQDPALFPWLNVRQNVAFGLRNQRLARKEREERVSYYLELVELGAFEKARIRELSGGMKQRVALARALAVEPEVILLDEPFAALDALTRERLYAQLQNLFAESKRTMIFVTHNTREAACLGDKIIVFSPRPARIKAVVPVPLARPRDFYDPEVSRLAGAVLHELRLGEAGL